MSDLVLAHRFLQRRLLYAFARRAFETVEPGRAFMDAWHFHHLCYMLEEAAAGRLRRLIINVPPRSFKSFLASQAFIAWVLGNDPSKRFICVSHSEQLARYFAYMTKTIMQAPWYGALFPQTRFVSSRPSDRDLRTTLHGFRLAYGMGGSITGRGADIIVCDDPTKAQDALSTAGRLRAIDYAESTLLSRLDDRQHGVIILVMQRLHENDLSGHLARNSGWTVVSLPAIATENTTHRIGRRPGDVYHRVEGELLQPSRDTVATLEEQRITLGTYNFQAQYQQQPVPAAGNILRREWLQYYEAGTLHLTEMDHVVLSWDTASTLNERSDYSVGTIWGHRGDSFYLLEVVRGRWQVPALEREIVEAWNYYSEHCQNRCDLLIENDGIGRGVAQGIFERRLIRRRPLLVSPDADKAARFERHMPLFEQGRIHLPRERDWFADYVSELLAFPNGSYDDQVDSTSQALDHLAQRLRRRIPPERRDPSRRDPVRRDILPREMRRR